MAISGSAVILSRLTNVRNIIRNVSNQTNISSRINQNLFLTTRTYTVDINSIIDTSEDEPKPKKKMSKAMKAYLERAREHDQFMKKEITEYQIGKRHLANMMGENPETFTQNDVNVSIRYLFPSGLYDKYAKPIMETPEKVFPPRKAAQFDESGRPHLPLFYTCKPNYYQILYDIVENMEQLNDIENKALKNGVLPHQDAKINLIGSDWLTKQALEQKTLEILTDEEYDKFIAAVDRLAEHPHAFQMKDFIMGLRKMRVLATESLIIPKLEYTPEGRPYITVKDSKRKTARATVTVFGNGTGKITINGKDIRYFHDIQSREQVSETLSKLILTYFSVIWHPGSRSRAIIAEFSYNRGN